MNTGPFLLICLFVSFLFMAGACTASITTSQTLETPQQIRVARYDGPSQLDESPKGLAVDGDGNIYVTGISSGGTDTYNNSITIKYDTDGNLVWVERYNNKEDSRDKGRAIAVDEAGNVYVAGLSTEEASTNYDIVTIKYGQ